ncbi:MAG: cysteine dioxygenase family protein [Phycisphaerae bacterium]
MTTKHGCRTLDSLFAYLDGLTERATLDDLKAHLADLDVTLGDATDYVRFSEQRYMRNLMRQGPMYHLLVLCWRSGQRSPIHNHAGSACGVRVLSGTATETVFERTPSGLLKAAASRDLGPGGVTASEDADTHQVSNLQAPGVDLVTLHIYSPPLLRMDTFSLLDGTVGEFRPIITEHIHGCGI